MGRPSQGGPWSDVSEFHNGDRIFDGKYQGQAVEIASSSPLRTFENMLTIASPI
jgi:hypothetical protein